MENAIGSSQQTAVSGKQEPKIHTLTLFLTAYCLLLTANPRLSVANAAETKPALLKPASSLKTMSETKATTPDPDVKKLRRIVEGQVVYVSKRSISVEYEEKKQMQEMLLPLGAELKVEGVASLLELKRGDRVKVGVEQTYREVPDGEPSLLKTEALVIILVQRAADAVATFGATPAK